MKNRIYVVKVNNNGVDEELRLVLDHAIDTQAYLLKLRSTAPPEVGVLSVEEAK